MKPQELIDLLKPISDFIPTLEVGDPADATKRLCEKFPVDGELFQKVREGLRAGIEAQTLCDRENAGVRFSRLLKPTDAFPFSIDLVHLDGAGAGHTHPEGEISMCFAVDSDAPKFDGHPEGWVIYGPGTWHEPTVTDGAMDFIYYLPNGAMKFGPKPD